MYAWYQGPYKTKDKELITLKIYVLKMSRQARETK